MKNSAIILLLVLCGIVWGGTYSGGDGSQATPYRIENISDWEEFADTEADQQLGIYLILTANIDFGGNEVDMISSPDCQFDGDNHTLSNGTVSTSADNHTALFSNPGDNLDIKDLIVSGFEITGHQTTSSTYVAVLVSELTTAGTITNCHIVNCSISMAHSLAGQDCYVGMLAGSGHGNITNCTSSGIITADTAGGATLDIGGIVGRKAGAAEGTETGISGCSSYVTCQSSLNNSTSTTYITIGGIAGTLQDGVNGTGLPFITNCYYQGSINYTAGSAVIHCGGITGTSASIGGGAINGSGAISNITIVSTSQCRIGGLVGLYQGGTIDKSYSSSNIACNVAAGSYVGGFAGYLESFLPTGSGMLTVQDCYAVGTIYDTSNNQTSLSFRFGGFAGQLYDRATGTGQILTVTRCWTALCGYGGGTYSGDTTYIGGFAANAVYDPVYSDCLWDSDKSGMSDGLANVAESGEVVAKTTEQLKTQATYTDLTYDFAGEGQAWKMFPAYNAAACTYPYLLWKTYPYSGGAGTSNNPYKIKTLLDWNWAYGNIDVRTEATTYFRLERDSVLATELMVIKQGYASTPGFLSEDSGFLN
jgi:hypothetical protein